MNNENVNYFHILRLLLEIGTKVYRETLKNRLLTVSACVDVIFKEKKKLWSLMNNSQRNILFPANGKYEGDLTDLDISVLYILLKNISSMGPPKKGWGEEPEETDRSVAANVERIRLYRNKYLAHSPNAQIHETEFKKVWTSLRKSIIELSTEVSYETAIDELLTEKSPQSEITKTIEDMKEETQSVQNRITLFEGILYNNKLLCFWKKI